MKRSPLVAFVVVAIAAVSTLIHAGPAKPPKEWKQPEWKVAKQQFDVISAVDVAAGTVSIKHVGGKDKQDHDLKTNAFTEVIVAGNKATLGSLSKGMHVTYTLGGDSTTAARIETVVEPPPPPTPVPTATPSFPGKKK